MKIYYTKDREKHYALDSALFMKIEEIFDTWLENSNPAGEYEEKYFGWDAIYSKKGAIWQAIDMIFDYMEEEELKVISIDHPSLDFWAIFEG